MKVEMEYSRKFSDICARTIAKMKPQLKAWEGHLEPAVYQGRKRYSFRWALAEKIASMGADELQAFLVEHGSTPESIASALAVMKAHFTSRLQKAGEGAG